LNVSERLTGRQTNQRAEIMACCRALEIAKKQKFSNLEIRTDSMFVINVMTDWLPRWKENGWKTISGKCIANEDDIRQLDNSASGVNIKWTHVPGHCGVFGNEEADKLARNGASRSQ
jgi:ribonuclease HI